MNKNHFAINMITKGIANPKSLITKGIITPYSYEIIKDGKVIRRGSGLPGRELRDYIEKHDPDLIKVYVNWNKEKAKYKEITAELIKKEITVELLENLGKVIENININVEIIG